LCPYVEPDYVPNYENVVPQAVQSCGATFRRFEPLTDGAANAVFEVSADRAAAVLECIKNRVPQGHVEMRQVAGP